MAKTKTRSEAAKKAWKTRKRSLAAHKAWETRRAKKNKFWKINKTKIKVSSYYMKRAKTFSEKVVSTVNYKDSNQTNQEKIKQNHYISKLGEAAVKLLFSQVGYKVKGPDFKIYIGRNKSWDADLMVDGIEIAVKTQSSKSAEKYGLSWLFQYSRIRKDPILNNPECWVIFVKYDEDTNVCYIYPPKQIKELKFGDPKVRTLIGRKKVVYAIDNFPEFFGV